ncbi:uncharacterized protein [Miscanthus floridulus]|uniref:uncharacterized protein n=1 Tax=Miscanthus floridulus TaxID=154761 RepID=UPI00345ABAD8
MLSIEIDRESSGSADGRTKPQKKNCSPSLTTIRHDFAGGVVVVETTGAWTGAKKAKVQEGAHASEDLDITAVVDVINPKPEQGAEGQVKCAFDWRQVKGFDWTEANVKVETDSFGRYFGLRDQDDDYWNFCDEQRTKDLQRRFAVYRIRAHKGAKLSDAEVMSMLEEDGYFRDYERIPQWYFDHKRCRIVGFQDYQRLALHDYGYQNWAYYHKACSTLESDQQFVYLWEKLSDKTKLEEGEAYWLIVEAVKKIVPRLKTYYEYAKKKLDIAKKMGLIPSSPHKSST